MNRAMYLEALHRLSRRVENPTPADVETITPHLTEEQRKQALTPNEGESAYFAIPPVRVRHGYLVASYRGYEGVYHLNLAFASRTLKSYADGKPHGDVSHDTIFQAEAMAYTEEHWGDHLILDTWNAFGQVDVQDPTDLYKSGDVFTKGSPKTKAVVYYTLDRDFNDVMNDHSAPNSEMWNRALVEITTDHIVGMELKGGRGGYTHFNCAYCSHGLHLTECGNCEHTFRDNSVRSGWDTPLPEKMVALLQESGHQFGMDPAIARQRERQNWRERMTRRYNQKGE